ncbi:hypothetical protein GCM10017562_39780 [Streptomyces roseofulvus]
MSLSISSGSQRSISWATDSGWSLTENSAGMNSMEFATFSQATPSVAVGRDTVNPPEQNDRADGLASVIKDARSR